MCLFVNNHQKYFKVQKVELQGFNLTCKRPTNVIQLNDGKIFMIDSILNISENCAVQENVNNLYIYGTIENRKKRSLRFTHSVNRCWCFENSFLGER